MIFAALVQFVICFLILRWLLKKTGVSFSKKSVVKFVLFGATGVVLWFCLSLVLPLEEDTFYDMNPLLAGF